MPQLEAELMLMLLLMEKKLAVMAQEMEKLHEKIANAEKRARDAAVTWNPGMQFYV